MSGTSDAAKRATAKSSDSVNRQRVGSSPVSRESAPEKLVSVAPDTSVLAAMEIMTEQRIRHIPCIAPAAKDGSRGAKMEGIVTIGDVVKALLSEEREEVQVCRDYISGNFDHYA